MEDQNVIIFLDKVKKLIELGNKPKAIIEIDALMELLNKNVARSTGKIEPVHIPDKDFGISPYEFGIENRQKINEIINFLNRRFM